MDSDVSTQDLVNAVAASLADWWRHHQDTDLLFDAYDALECMYPNEVVT